jgi:hypothetical protein
MNSPWPNDPVEMLRTPYRPLKWASSGTTRYYGDYRVRLNHKQLENNPWQVSKVLGFHRGQLRYEPIAEFELLHYAKKFVEATHELSD